MALNKVVPKERDRITISVSQEMRARIDKVASLMGFGTSEAVRYLMARGLEGLTAVTATSDSASALRSMMDLFERQEALEVADRKSRSGPSNTRSTAEKSSGAALFDVPSVAKKSKK